MARIATKIDVLRALFARSGNQCAFTGCTQPLINDKNKFIAQVCHIESASEGAKRFNPEGNDEHRRSYENLLILCYPHHIETNDAEEYPVDRLLHIKRDHEQLFLKSDFKIDESELANISYEMGKYWLDIYRLNKLDHVFSELAMDVNGKNSFFDVIASAYDAVNSIGSLMDSFHSSDEELKADFEALLIKKDILPELFNDIPYYANPFENRNWESHNLGAPNCLQRLRIDLVHIEVKFIEEYLKTHSDDLHAKAKFEKAKEKLKEYAETATHVD